MNNHKIDKAIKVLKILCSKTRFQIISLLMKNKNNLCVLEISDIIGLSHSATSHQLAKLEAQGIVYSERIGQTNCYRLSNSSTTKILSCVMDNFK